MTSFDYHPDRRQFTQSVTAAIAGLSWPMRALAAERRWTAIQKLTDGYVADKKMAGAGVAIAYGGAPVRYLAAGTIAFDSQKRFDEHSICRIHSLTKPVTGIAAMLPVEDGKLALDQPVADVLPEFRARRDRRRTEPGFSSRDEDDDDAAFADAYLGPRELRQYAQAGGWGSSSTSTTA